jgi:DNA-binding Lrp family transcriptional regulator
MALTDFDRALIKATQSGLPLVSRPYEAVGAMLGVPGERVRERLAQMLDEGLIRRIGAVPNHYRLGFTANGMSVWDVDDTRSTNSVRASARWPASATAIAGRAICPTGPTTCSRCCMGVRAKTWCSRRARSKRCSASACRGHDILYSTAILKKTGLRLTGN